MANQIKIDPKDLDIELRAISQTYGEYLYNKAVANVFIKTGDTTEMSLKLRGFIRQYLREQKEKKKPKPKKRREYKKRKRKT